MVLRARGSTDATIGSGKVRSPGGGRGNGNGKGPNGGGGSSSSVLLLLHGEGVPASTTIVDSSSYAHTISQGVGATGSVQIDGSQFKYGSCSLFFSTINQSWITVPNHAAFDMGSGDFTIEAWIRLGLGGNSGIARGIISKRATGGVTPFVFYAVDDGQLQGYTSFSGSSTFDVALVAPAGTLATSTWTHVAYVREGNTWSLYRGTLGTGTRVATTTLAGTMMSNTSKVAIGATGADDGSSYFRGHMDEVRITKGVALYSGTTYTVPSAAFPDA